MVIENTSTAGSNLFVIIVAAGSGTRFGSDIPKQFLPLKGKPVLVHALEAFAAEFPAANIILVLSPDGGIDHWREASRFYSGQQPHIVYGGDSRTASVANALDAVGRIGIDGSSVVMIHDGARPIVNRIMIRGLYNMLASDSGAKAAAPCYALTEALAANEDGNITPTPRSGYCAVQTPQTFNASMLIEAYRCLKSETSGNTVYDDDIAVFKGNFPEVAVSSFEGDRNNIKITRPADIRIAEILMEMPVPYSPQYVSNR